MDVLLPPIQIVMADVIVLVKVAAKKIFNFRCFIHMRKH